MKSRSMALGLLAVWVVPFAQATTMVRLSLDQLSQAASYVVRGRVIRQDSRWNENHTRILTITTLAVEQALKGRPPTTLEIEQPGGTVGDIHVHVAGIVRFQPQNSYWVFLEPSTSTPARYQVVGMIQGAFPIFRETSTGEERVTLPMGSLTRGRSGAPGPTVNSGPTLPLRDFQQRVAASVNAPPAIPSGTALSVVIHSAEPRGVGNLDVVARTTADIFPNRGLAIPAGCLVEGTAVRVSQTWKIHWDEINVRGTRIPISASSQEPANGSLEGRTLLIEVR